MTYNKGLTIKLSKTYPNHKRLPELIELKAIKYNAPKRIITGTAILKNRDKPLF